LIDINLEALGEIIVAVYHSFPPRASSYRSHWSPVIFDRQPPSEAIFHKKIILYH
jgi:hypothetical protein